MEQSVNILRVRRITKDSKGNAINIVVLDLMNGKPSIIRNSAQFIQDCKNSFLVADNVNSINHPAMSRVLKGMKRGTVSGDITYNKKGDLWTVTADSRVIHDSSHPQYNKVGVGSTLPYEADNTRVEGFLDIELNAETEDRLANAGALAEATIASRGIFDVLSIGTSVSANDEPAITPNVLDDITGGVSQNILDESDAILIEDDNKKK